MKIILQDGNKYILRFDKGEELIEELTKFSQQENIEAGFINGIGGAGEITLSFFDMDKKEYVDNVYDKEDNYEVVTLTGSISKFNDDTIVHVHGCFSGSDLKAFAGHVKKLLISITCEIKLEKLNGKMGRKHNEEIDLNLMD